MRPFAVVDVETTGLNPYLHDRIIELAVVLMSPQMGVLEEFSTLINPERDVGPTRIHGIMASDVINAPIFAEMAGHLSDFLKGAVLLAGHNVRFDISFLQAEYKRIGVAMPRYPTFDTMRLAGGGTLKICCSSFGIPFEGDAHCALNDARAAALLLHNILTRNPDLVIEARNHNSPAWPCIDKVRGNLVLRENVSTLSIIPSFIQDLATQLSSSSLEINNSEGEMNYRDLLWRSLEDGYIDQSEGDALFQVATNWGVSFERIKSIHMDYIHHLIKKAMEDRIITKSEQSEIQKAAKMLGLGLLSKDQINDLCILLENENRPINVSSENLSGKSVCFTGESRYSNCGELISRAMAERFAVDKGLKVAHTVTKKLDILVVSDPNTQSSKAKKARKYGIRIIHEPVFWRSLGIIVD